MILARATAATPPGDRCAGRRAWIRALVAACLLAGGVGLRAADPLQDGFRTVPVEARPWAYWWWLNTDGSSDF
jgi:hypothetical protein